MTEQEMAKALGEILDLHAEALCECFRDGGSEYCGDLAGCRISSFEDVGLLTDNEGVVVRLRDGSEFQITVKKSR